MKKLFGEVHASHRPPLDKNSSKSKLQIKNQSLKENQLFKCGTDRAKWVIIGHEHGITGKGMNSLGE